VYIYDSSNILYYTGHKITSKIPFQILVHFIDRSK